MTDQPKRPDDATPDPKAPDQFTYNTTPATPRRTVDHPGHERPATPAAQDALRALVNETDAEGRVVPSDMPSPHLGPRFTQRQAARKLLAGRSYQAVQAWLAGEPVPAVTADWLEQDLQRIDNRAEDRMIRVAADEIVIVVKR